MAAYALHAASPRYLFVRLDLERERWRSVNSTVGVSSTVCCSDRPATLADRIVEDIRATEGVGGLVFLAHRAVFKRGGRIRVAAGPLADQLGIFDCMGDQQRVLGPLNLLGREARV